MMQRQKSIKNLYIVDLRRTKTKYGAFANSVHLNVNDMMDAALRNTRIEMSQSERRRFFEKYIKNMMLRIDEKGNVGIELKQG